MQSAIQSKSDRDKIRQRASNNRAQLDAVKKIIRDYAQGRAASACMGDIIHILKGVK